MSAETAPLSAVRVEPVVRLKILQEDWGLSITQYWRWFDEKTDKITGSWMMKENGKMFIEIEHHTIEGFFRKRLTKESVWYGEDAIMFCNFFNLWKVRVEAPC